MPSGQKHLPYSHLSLHAFDQHALYIKKFLHLLVKNILPLVILVRVHLINMPHIKFLVKFYVF
jgi:hypothetical protein